MVVQCRVCKRVRDNGQFRPPWPGELPLKISESYCPRCARDTVEAIRRGETPFHYENTIRPAAS